MLKINISTIFSKGIKITLQMLEENKTYPLDAINILEYINLWKGLK